MRQRIASVILKVTGLLGGILRTCFLLVCLLLFCGAAALADTIQLDASGPTVINISATLTGTMQSGNVSFVLSDINGSQNEEAGPRSYAITSVQLSNLQLSVAPEPTTLGMIGLGIIAASILSRRHTARHANRRDSQYGSSK